MQHTPRKPDNKRIVEACKLITKAINYRRKGEQKEANRRRLDRQEE